MEFAGKPGAGCVGAMIDDAPGAIDGETVDGVLVCRVADRQFVTLASPGELAGANAVRKGKQNEQSR